MASTVAVRVTCLGRQGNSRRFNLRTAKNRIIAALAFSAVASPVGAVTVLTNQYTVNAYAVNVGANQYQFNYSVLNNNQSIGSMTGLAYFTIYVPLNSYLLASVVPSPYSGSPGYWLSAYGSNPTEVLPATPAGYQPYTWTAYNPQAVYPVGTAASFSITLGNVAAGSNAVGATTYWGFSAPSYPYVLTGVGTYYSSFAGNALSPSAIPEPLGLSLVAAGLLAMTCAIRWSPGRIIFRPAIRGENPRRA